MPSMSALEGGFAHQPYPLLNALGDVVLTAPTDLLVDHRYIIEAVPLGVNRACTSPRGGLWPQITRARDNVWH